MHFGVPLEVKIKYLHFGVRDRLKVIMKAVLIVGALILQTFASEKQQFNDYKVLRIIPKDVESVELLIELEKSEHYHFWNEIKNVHHFVDVMVPPYKIEELEDLLRSSNVESSVFISNVQEMIDNQKAKVREEDFGWKDYYTLDEVSNRQTMVKI